MLYQNYQVHKIKKYTSFSILELMLVIVILSIIMNFAIPKFKEILNSSNKTVLKSQYALIQQGILELKTKYILLAKDKKIVSLDDAPFNISNKELFIRVVEFPIISTNSSEKKEASWIKKGENKYQFILTVSKIVSFELTNEKFICKKPLDICEDLN